MLPYTKFLLDNSLYPHDFYIQSIAASVPNERIVFSYLLSFTGDYLEWAVFGLHVLTTLLLVFGIYRLISKSVKTEPIRWTATLCVFFFLYGINLGGNELYYNSFLPSYVAQVIGIWVFVLLLEGVLFRAYILLMLITYIHPLIGIQLWLLFSLSLATMFFVDKDNIKIGGLIVPNLLYLSIAGYFVYQIKSGYDTTTMSPQAFLDIIEFRAAHHYFPHYFPVKNYLILALPFYLGWVISGAWTRWFFRWALLGLVVYIVGVYILHHPTPLSTQWFSTTVWIKTFSFFIFFSLIEGVICQNEKRKALLQKLSESDVIPKLLSAVALISLFFMTPQYRLFPTKPYHFPFTNYETDDIQIAQQAQILTPRNALFLIPPDCSAFRYWSERSSYVDYKATNHRQSAFANWYARIREIYKINLADRRAGADLPALANTHFSQLTETDFLALKEKTKVTHILSYKNRVLQFPKLAENSTYVIYQIK
jgi:hypothetical protein